jgi:hypothetical protein
LSFSTEPRWDGAKTLADAMNMLRHQVAITVTRPSHPVARSFGDGDGNPTVLL